MIERERERKRERKMWDERERERPRNEKKALKQKKVNFHPFYSSLEVRFKWHSWVKCQFRVDLSNLVVTGNSFCVLGRPWAPQKKWLLFRLPGEWGHNTHDTKMEASEQKRERESGKKTQHYLQKLEQYKKREATFFYYTCAYWDYIRLMLRDAFFLHAYLSRVRNGNWSWRGNGLLIR